MPFIQSEVGFAAGFCNPSPLRSSSSPQKRT
jgi:hypothetical protein